MEKKTIQKSVRLKESLFNFVNRFDGKGFNDKLESMVDFYEKKSKTMDDEIKQKQKKLDDLNKEIKEKQEIANKIRETFRTLDSIYWHIRDKG